MIDHLSSTVRQRLVDEPVEASAKKAHLTVSAPHQATEGETGVARGASDPHGEAVIVTLSEDSTAKQNGDARQAGQPGRDLSQAFREHGFLELRSPEETKLDLTEIEISSKLAHETIKRDYAQIADDQQALIAYLEAADPIPERTLSGDEAEAARERFKDAKPVMTSTDGAKSFLEDDMLYRISANGEVTVRHRIIPTSEDAKQSFLDELKKSLTEALEITGGRSAEQIDRDIENIRKSSQSEAAGDDPSASQGDAPQPGQLVDSRV